MPNGLAPSYSLSLSLLLPEPPCGLGRISQGAHPPPEGSGWGAGPAQLVSRLECGGAVRIGCGSQCGWVRCACVLCYLEVVEAFWGEGRTE